MVSSSPPPDGSSPPADPGPHQQPGRDASAAPSGSLEPDAASPGRRGLSALLISRPVTVVTLFLTILGTGLLAYLKIPLTYTPAGIAGSSLSVILPFPGAGPAEVQDQLTRPVEETLRTIPGITDIISISTEGTARVEVVFSSAVDMDVAYGEVRDRIERVRPSLPAEMDRYRIRRFNIDALPIMWMGVRYDADDPEILSRIERVFIPRLEGADGVAGTNLHGVVEDVCRIFVDIEKAKGYGVNLGEVIRGLQLDNFTLPAGRIDDGGRTFNVRLDARFHSVEEVAAYPVGNGMVLADVAEVVVGKALRDRIWRINGSDALGLSITKESGANTIETCTQIEAVIEELTADPRFKDVDVDVFWSQKEDILRAIQGLQSSALWGGLFAIVILWLFLRDLRTTLIAALAIPSSLLAALTAVYFSGMTLNLMSLAGFTLGIGMLVDNAVVVIETISRKRAAGLSRKVAAAKGTAEVGLAVVTATSTSIVVFLPLIFMDGDRNTRIIMREIGLPITYSLLASLLVAMVFIPTFASRLMRRKETTSDVELSPRLVGRYRRVLSWALQHRLGTFVILLLAIQAAGAATKGLTFAVANNGGMDNIRVDVDTPPTYALAEVNSVFERLELWAEANAEEMGFDFYSTRFNRRGGGMYLYPAEDLDPELREGMDRRLRESLPQLPGVELQVGWDGGAAAVDTVRLNVHGPDFGELMRITGEVKQRLSELTAVVDGRTVPMFEEITSDIDDGLSEIHVDVDRDRAAALGIQPDTIRGMVAWGLGGQRLPDLQLGDHELPMIIEYAQDEQESLEFIRNLELFRSTTGSSVPLASVADLRFEKSLAALVRRNGISTLGLAARPASDNVYEVARGIDSVVSDTPLPEGYSWTEEGGRSSFEEDTAELQRAGLLAFCLVYLLMAILLESVILPLCILVSVPLAGIGVIVTLMLTGIPFDVMVVVGMILLVGIVVNNAIVLLDRVQYLRRSGMPRDQALVEGGADRLRPILMTAVTTIFGLMPMALPDFFPGSGDSGYQSLAVAVAGGLACSTLLTLVIVPWAYSLVDDLGCVLKSLVRDLPVSEQAPMASGSPPDVG